MGPFPLPNRTTFNLAFAPLLSSLRPAAEIRSFRAVLWKILWITSPNAPKKVHFYILST
jgi:hypothetical protein